MSTRLGGIRLQVVNEWASYPGTEFCVDNRYQLCVSSRDYTRMIRVLQVFEVPLSSFLP